VYASPTLAVKEEKGRFRRPILLGIVMDAVKILVYNVERGGPPPRRERIQERIQEIRADVTIILEAVGWRTRRVGEAIARPMGGKVFYGSARTGFDLAILTRLESRNPLRHPDLDLFHGLLSLEVQVTSGEWVRIHAAHLSPSREENRVREVKAILQALDASDGMGEIIAGDFNGIRRDDTVEGVPVADVPPGMGPMWRQDKIPPRAVDMVAEAGWIDLFREIRPTEEGYTFPARLPVVRYDYAFANAALRPRVADIQVLRDEALPDLSDHLPLLITLPRW
jgi:endonuclease/exonuclease/phosphatase family metal-dependent hydrolase